MTYCYPPLVQLVSPSAVQQVSIQWQVCDPVQLQWREGVTLGANKYLRIEAPPLFRKSWNFAPNEAYALISSCFLLLKQ